LLMLRTILRQAGFVTRLGRVDALEHENGAGRDPAGRLECPFAKRTEGAD